jgi:prolycopene isomerase
MTCFERGDYRFEVSLHAIDGLDPGGLTYGFFHQLGIYDRIHPVKPDPMYRTVYPDLVMDVPADTQAYARRLKERFPDEAEGIDDLFAAFGRIYTIMASGMDFMNGDVLSGMWGGVRHPLCLATLLRNWNTTAGEMVGRYVQDERLIRVFTQLAGFLGDGPDSISAPVFAAMWNSYHRHGYYYVEGGSQAVSDALAAVIKENGGEILLSTRVTQIRVADGRATGVKTDDGRDFDARYVISNANAPDTLFKLVGRQHLPADYTAAVESMEIGASALVVYLGVDHDFRAGFKGSHEIFVNLAGQGDRAADFSAIRSVNADVDELPFVIADYSVVDPSCAPAGKNVICLTTIMPYDWQQGWYEDRGYEEYRQLKNAVGLQLVGRAEKFLPGLGDHIEIMEVGTPRTMAHYTLNPKGAILGWANTPEQSMFKRLPQETPIDNLFLAGAWTFPCGGQSAVIMSGVFAAEKVLADMD